MIEMLCGYCGRVLNDVPGGKHDCPNYRDPPPLPEPLTDEEFEKVCQFDYDHDALVGEACRARQEVYSLRLSNAYAGMEIKKLKAKIERLKDALRVEAQFSPSAREALEKETK